MIDCVGERNARKPKFKSSVGGGKRPKKGFAGRKKISRRKEGQGKAQEKSTPREKEKEKKFCGGGRGWGKGDVGQCH